MKLQNDEKFYQLENNEIQELFRDKRLCNNMLLIRAIEIIKDSMIIFNNNSLKNITIERNGAACHRKTPMGNYLTVYGEILETESVLSIKNNITYKIKGIVNFTKKINQKKVHNTINLLNKINIINNCYPTVIYCVNDSLLEFSFIETVDPNEECLENHIARHITQFSLQAFFIEAIVGKYTKKIQENSLTNEVLRNVLDKTYPLCTGYYIKKEEIKNNATVYKVECDLCTDEDIIQFEKLDMTIAFEDLDVEYKINNNKTSLFLDMEIFLGHTISYVELPHFFEIVDWIDNELRKIMGFARSRNSLSLAIKFKTDDDRIIIRSSLCFDNNSFGLEWIIKTYIIILKKIYMFM